MATILKKEGLKVTAFDSGADTIETIGVVIGTETLDEAKITKIGTNETLATQAASDASQAQTDATTAIGNASAAQTAANNAQTTANSAQADATTAISDAGDAGSIADAAQVDATQALSDANDASVAAGDAAILGQQGIDDALAAQGVADNNAIEIANNTSSINGIANSTSFGSAAKAITVDAAPAELGTVVVPFSDDEAPSLDSSGYTIGELIIFDANSGSRKIGKISALTDATHLEITYVGVDTLENEKMHHVKLNFLNSPAEQELRSIFAVDATKMVKVADEVWDSAVGIALGTFTSGAGVVDSSDSVLSAVQKLDGNIESMDVGANAALSNLSNVAINTSLLFEDQNKAIGSALVNVSRINVHEIHSNDNMYVELPDTKEFAVYINGDTALSLSQNNGFRTYDSGNCILQVKKEGTGASAYTGISSVENLEVEGKTLELYSADAPADTNSGSIIIETGSVSGTGERGEISIKAEMELYDNDDNSQGGIFCAEAASSEEGLHVMGYGDLYLQTEDAEVTNADGSDINIYAGLGDGTGANGSVFVGSDFFIGDKELVVPNNSGEAIAWQVTTKEYFAGKYGCFFNGDQHSDMNFIQSCAPEATEHTPPLMVRSGMATGASNNSGDIALESGPSSNGNSGDVYISAGDADNGTKGTVIINDLVDPTNQQDPVTLAYMEANSAGNTSEITTNAFIPAQSIIGLDVTGKAVPVIADGSLDREVLEMLYFAQEEVASSVLGEFTMARADVVLSGAANNEIVLVSWGDAMDDGQGNHNYGGSNFDLFTAQGRHHFWFSDDNNSSPTNDAGAFSVTEISLSGTESGADVAQAVASSISVASIQVEGNVEDNALALNELRITETSGDNVTDPDFSSVGEASVSSHQDGGSTGGGTPGQFMYLSDTAAGELTDTKPTAVGTDVILLGRFNSEGAFQFAPKYLMTN